MSLKYPQQVTGIKERVRIGHTTRSSKVRSIGPINTHTLTKIIHRHIYTHWPKIYVELFKVTQCLYTKPRHTLINTRITRICQRSRVHTCKIAHTHFQDTCVAFTYSLSYIHSRGDFYACVCLICIRGLISLLYAHLEIHRQTTDKKVCMCVTVREG